MAQPNVGQLLAHPQIRAAIERALAAKGVKGDSIIAHLDPREAAMLKMMGGVGTVNPATGLRQFYDPDAGHSDPTGSAGTHGGPGDIGAGGAGRVGDSGFGGLGDRISGAIDRIGNAIGSNFGSGWGSRGVAGGYGNASLGGDSGAGAGGGHSGQNYISQTYGTQSGIPNLPAPAPAALPSAPVISNMPQAPVALTPMMSSTAPDLAGGERFGALPSWATQPYQVGTAPSSYPTPGVNAGLGAPGFAGNPLPGQPGGGGLSPAGGGGLSPAGGGGILGGGGGGGIPGYPAGSVGAAALPSGNGVLNAPIGGTSALASKTIPQILAMHLSPGALNRLTTPQNPWLMLPGSASAFGSGATSRAAPVQQQQQQRPQVALQGPVMGQTAARPIAQPTRPIAQPARPATMTAAQKLAAQKRANLRTGGKNFG